MKHCVKCIMPDTKPDLTLDEEGVCSACRTSEQKTDDIDWDARRKELKTILENYKSKDGSKYDCIIPVSGGKDSLYQVYIIKEEFGLNPLCVTFAACKSTEVGKKNLQNLRDMGVDHILFTPNPKVYKKLFKLGLIETGDSCWPCHAGIFTYPIHVAVQHKVPLLIWGENPQLEYGGPATATESANLDREWLYTYGGLLGKTIESFVGKEGLTLNDLKPYIYPTDEEIEEVGVTGLWLGYYKKWDARKQLELVKKWGFNVRDTPVPGSILNYENLDCGFVDIHDFFMFLKYGFGRATAQACIDIRNGRLTRDDAEGLAKENDGKLETVKDLCEFIGITEDEFWKIADEYRNKDIWTKDENSKWILK